MIFDLTEDQALLKAMVDRCLGDRYGPDPKARRRSRADPAGFDRDGWDRLAAMGLLSLPFAEADCGLGGGPVELVIAAEAVGRALAVEPLTECLATVAPLLALAAPAAQRSALIGAVITGTALMAPALLEAGGRYALDHVKTIAVRDPHGWRVEGAKSAVWQGMAASHFLLSVRLASDAGSIGLLLVPADTPGVERRGWRAADGQMAAELTLRGVFLPAEALLDAMPAPTAIDAAVFQAWLAASAEMLGIASRLFETTLDYVKSRQQFGRPIGQFQAIQHRLVDCHVALEQARSMVWRATLAPTDDAPRAIAGAKAFVSEACRTIAHEAVQLHGGMGMTDELIVGHGLKRIQLLSRLWGDPDAACRRYAALAA